MTKEAHKTLQFLCSMPSGHDTLTSHDLKSLLLETGGQVMVCGSLYEIKSTRLGAGVHRVSLERWKP